MAPKVLISDSLSEAAVQIFRDRGIDVDFQPNLGKDKDALAAIIGNYDGLAIRSATKATAKLIEAATNLKVIGRAGIGVDNVDIPAASAKGIVVMNTPFGNSITTAEHAIALMFALAREIPAADASTQAGKWEKSKFMGVEITSKTLGVIGCGLCHATPPAVGVLAISAWFLTISFKTASRGPKALRIPSSKTNNISHS